MSLMPESIKSKLNVAFAALRTQGFIAKQAFSCCCGCASGEIADQLAKRPGKQLGCKGAVFYTRQDAQSCTESRRDRYGRRTSQFLGLYLAFGPVHVEDKLVGLPTAEVGQAVATALREAGLEVEWDGDEDKRIVVHGEVPTAGWAAA